MMEDANAVLQELIRKDEPIMLVNTYKGVPVSFPAIFLDEDQAEFTVKAHPFQSLCIDINKLTILKSESLEKPLMAFAASVDPAESVVTLSSVRFASSSVGNRKYNRVVPSEHVEVSLTPLEGDQAYIKGILNDISTHGLGFQTWENVELDEGSDAVFSFSLIYGKKELNFIGIKGIIRNIFSQPESESVRIGVELLPDADQQDDLEQYIQYRSKMINEELQLLMPIVE